MATDDVYTTRQAAKRLGVSLRTVQLWVESGVLPAWKTAGGHRRIARTAVENLVRERESALDRPAASKNFKILVVEDEASLRKLYRLKFAGWDLPVETLTAANGYEALLIIGDQRPDLLIADLSMPGMDGFRMIRTLKSSSDHRDIEVVVVTALDASEIEDRGGLPEGVKVFTKPVPFPELESIVRRRLARRPGSRAKTA